MIDKPVPSIDEECCSNCKWYLSQRKGSNMRTAYVCANPVFEKEKSKTPKDRCDEFTDRGALHQTEDFWWWLSECRRRREVAKPKMYDKIDRYLQVYRLYEDGKSAKEIACMMDLSLSWVYSIIETHYGCHGDDRPEALLVFEGAKGGRFTDQEREWVFDKYMEGYTQDQIAEVTGRTQATISNAIQKVRRAHRK